MIINMLTSNNINLETFYDVAIIGAGAAGITIAAKLAKEGKKTALIEGGDFDYTDESQNLYKGQVIGDPYFDLDVTRLRYFGGSTNHWSGYCRNFEKIDFNREYLGELFKWPINILEIKKYQEKACKILEIKNSFSYENQNSEVKRIKFQFSKPVRFREKYFDRLKQSKNLDIFLNSSLTDLNGKNNTITSATFNSFNKKTITISSKKFVFAMGGLENNRYMLWFNEKYKNQFFSSNLPIGEYWMEHPHFTLGKAIVKRSKVPGSFYSISPNLQKELGIMNCGFRIKHFRDSKTKEIIRDISCIAPKLGKKLANMFNKNLVCGATFRAAWEQAPNKENKVLLDKKKDILGIPQILLFWKKKELDRKTITESIKIFNNWLLKSDLGRIQLDDWIVNKTNYPENDELGGHHHMGGTRMHENNKFGVVDTNCKVYGSSNLYIAGSSIFTTGGHNNPTLPIVAFALRLADHLKKQV